MSSQTNQPRVKRRRVFYIPGYDPIPPRRYRELYRSESARQAAISGYEISVSPKTGEGLYGWHVHSVQDGAEVHTDVEVLVWSDIVRSSMSNSIAATYLQMLRTAWIYISTGVLWRLMRLRKGPVIAALYPIVMLIAQLLVAMAVVIGLTVLLAPVLSLVALVLSIGVAYVLMLWFRKIDNKLFVYYLMHDYAYSAASGGKTPPELAGRLSEFTNAIAAALTDETDEVLIVGHSSGAHLGVTVLADLIRSGRVGTDGPELSFLTLGQVVPMVSFLPNAYDLRADLRFLSKCEDLAWVDISAPGDGCAFALCDPVAVSGVADADQRWPLVLSAAFTQTLSAERWRALRWRFFRLHFQYLCAFDHPDRYDYFRVTAGPLSLGHRFADRKPSGSRIVRSVSKYVSVQA
ncbi:hypothetical protein [Ruegeria faecimaris]|uniref:hypothetical protein n=1 Tax=Ruegeria faecimaris TaxID=686389 RepID=UPI00232D0227|nr:hypothetical protein [Ruegeria faecimaris]